MLRCRQNINRPTSSGDWAQLLYLPTAVAVAATIMDAPKAPSMAMAARGSAALALISKYNAVFERHRGAADPYTITIENGDGAGGPYRSISVVDNPGMEPVYLVCVFTREKMPLLQLQTAHCDLMSELRPPPQSRRLLNDIYSNTTSVIDLVNSLAEEGYTLPYIARPEARADAAEAELDRRAQQATTSRKLKKWTRDCEALIRKAPFNMQPSSNPSLFSSALFSAAFVDACGVASR